ncbi:hypothetical protein DL96DRAFT_1562486 [Flagelloscypha sp. PMI_526]|nr:hypothetical protein DL96DRAFT_1562486 [Flagelloscypha sp. PMI_526]
MMVVSKLVKVWRWHFQTASSRPPPRRMSDAPALLDASCYAYSTLHFKRPCDDVLQTQSVVGVGKGTSIDVLAKPDAELVERGRKLVRGMAAGRKNRMKRASLKQFRLFRRSSTTAFIYIFLPMISWECSHNYASVIIVNQRCTTSSYIHTSMSSSIHVSELPQLSVDQSNPQSTSIRTPLSSGTNHQHRTLFIGVRLTDVEGQVMQRAILHSKSNP